ncbi:MAG: methionyl-tRNA formyltransferase [Ruminococcus sp.]|nr:methionyl-tRNA formyltransferase [Ruminococcus sp.]
MRIIYMGTPDFAVKPLEALYHAGYEIVGVFTQPDKKKGRKQELTPPEVKVCAEKLGLSVYQPVSLKTDEAFSLIQSLAPEAIVVAAYGKLLPKNILDYPKYGCINIHASLLPKYRGAAPIQWSVLNGEKETGVTIMMMDEGIDTGDIIFTRAIPIEEDDTALSMFEKLSDLGAVMIVDALKNIESGDYSKTVQDDSLSCYSPMIKKEMGEIDWKKPSTEVHNLVRGMFDWPIAYTKLGGKTLKIYKSKKSALLGNPGEIVSLSPLTVACGEGSIEIIELQLEGKKRMDAPSFLMGRKLDVGTVLGE